MVFSMKPPKATLTNSTAGFSLIEVLVVIIMVAILAAIAAPSWVVFLNKQRVDAVQSDLKQTLLSAQQQAIQERSTVEVDVDIPTDVTTYLPAIQVGIQGSTLENKLLAESDSLREGMIELKSYTTSGGTPTDDAKFSFNYQGIVTDSSTNGQTLPLVISINSVSNPEIKKCVIVATLLGNLKTAEGTDCDNPTL